MENIKQRKWEDKLKDVHLVYNSGNYALAKKLCYAILNNLDRQSTVMGINEHDMILISIKLLLSAIFFQLV